VDWLVFYLPGFLTMIKLNQSLVLEKKEVELLLNKVCSNFTPFSLSLLLLGLVVYWLDL
jgi:hypothetical protein